MPRIERTATAEWTGNVARGQGAISGASGAFAVPYSLASRVGQPEGRTSPEELLAAAHAGCFAMSVAGELAGAGAPPGIVEVRCTIVMDEVEGQGHQIVGSRIEADVRGEGIDDGRLAEVIDRADEGCPFSSLLRRAGASVSVAAALV